MSKKRTTYIPTARGRKLGGALIGLGVFGALVLSAYLGEILWQ